MKLLKVDTIKEVQEKLDFYFKTMEKRVETIDLRSACGRYLATDVVADLDSPSFRRSVVDGYAVRASDTYGVSDNMPVFLEVVGSVEMGKPAKQTIREGQAVYVPTGSMVPEGADAMVMVEFVDLLGSDQISVNRAVSPNSDIMNVGDDFQKGTCFFHAGHRVEVKDVGLLAACGMAWVQVYQKPILTILSTGDELVEPHVKPADCQIRDINAYAVAAFAESAGGLVRSVSIIKDDWEDYRSALTEAINESDLVILSGGSSAGTKDLTAKVIDTMGSPGVITHGLAIKPGKPTIIGILQEGDYSKAVIGLPGHPLSSIIVFDVVVNGFLKKYYLGNHEQVKTVTAILTENVHAGEGRETYQLVTLQKGIDEGWKAQPIRAKSGAIAQLTLADGYVVIPAGKEGVKAGHIVDVIPMERR